MAVAQHPLRSIHRPSQLPFQLFQPPALLGCHAFQTMVQPHLSQLDTIFKVSQAIDVFILIRALEETLDGELGGQAHIQDPERSFRPFPIGASVLIVET